MNVRALCSAFAATALAAGVSGAALPVRALAGPAPTPSPTPSPPPQALSCTATNNPGLLYGVMPSSSSANVQVNTTIQVIPNNADGRAYLAYQESQVRAQEAQMNPKPAATSTPGNYLAVQNQSENFSALARRLAPFILTTSTDAQGNWACTDLTLRAPYLLFAAVTVNTTTTSTPPSAVASVTGSQPVTKTQTTQIYYAARATIQVFNKTSGFFRLNLPFSRWTRIANIVQPS